MQICVTRPIPVDGIQVLQAGGFNVTVVDKGRSLSPLELLAATASVDGLLSMLSDTITPAFLDARPNIRSIANFAVGTNNIDIPACTARKVGVSNTPEVLNDATAEIAWLLLMAAARRAGEGERMIRAEKWEGWGPLQLLGVDVVGQTLGIIGAGRIGARLARMAAGFDMKIVYHNRRASPEMDALGARLMSLEDLLRVSDFISIHVPLTPETRHLIGPAQLALMKKTAVLVNTARGPVVDEAALVDALERRAIFSAGLDVYEKEPLVHPGLLELENVVLLPHLGSATHGTRAKMSEMAGRNLLAMLSGKRPPNAVNPEVFG